MRMKTERKEQRSRWSAWAAGLAAGHRRLAARPPGLERVLARPREVGQILRERWLLAARHVQPRIHLAIQPVLRQTFWHPVGGASVPRQPVAMAPPPPPPLQAAFQRLRTADATPAAVPRAIEAIYQRLHAAARREAGAAAPQRIAQRLRRTEEPVFAPPPRVQRPVAAPAPEPMPAPPGAVPAWAASSSRSGQSWNPPAPPAIDVPALADRVMQQIGRRVEAWRERTGNL